MTPSSTRTSPFGISPMSGSIETTNPFRKTGAASSCHSPWPAGHRYRAALGYARLRQAASRCRMYSEHKHPGAGESTAPESGVRPAGAGLPRSQSRFTHVRGRWTTRAVRSVTVDTSRSRCAEWTPGRGWLFTVPPLWIERSMSSPGDRDPVADARDDGTLCAGRRERARRGSLPPHLARDGGARRRRRALRSPARSRTRRGRTSSRT